ncbi:MAG: flagellar basal body-associated FliL family protein [Chthonomonadaceae bacterium]|nr:flagellar basal body-associated FliL family protein [Chthonomonadaceae bacterium]
MAAAKEAAPAEGGKKKGKMPMLLALVVMLGAGGFFGSKMGGSKEKKEPPIELGEVMPLGEFLVNLRDGRTFLKTEIAVHIAKGQHLADEAGGGHGGGGKAEAPAPVRDAIVAVLSAQDLNTISTPEGKVALKLALAKAINAVAPKHHKEGEKSHGKEDKKDGHEKDKKKEEEHEEPEVLDETWDSQTGPVLKVYFTSFATQQ